MLTQFERESSGKEAPQSGSQFRARAIELAKFAERVEGLGLADKTVFAGRGLLGFEGKQQVIPRFAVDVLAAAVGIG